MLSPPNPGLLESCTVEPGWIHARIEFFEVADFTGEGSHDEIVKKGDFDYVIYTAVPTLHDTKKTDHVKWYEKPSIQG